MPIKITPASPSARADGPLALIREGPYFRVWLTGALANGMRWLEMLAVGVYVFEKTSSPLLVAFVLFCRLVPQVLFGAVLGALAEKINKKYLLISGLMTITLVSVVLGTLLITGKAQIWHLALGAFISGFLTAMDYPVRRNMLGEACGIERIGSGMALDATTTNVTRMLGPIMGGLILDTIGLHGAFILGACLHTVALLFVLTLRYTPAVVEKETVHKNFFADILEGLRYVRRNRVILAVMMITVTLNFFAMPYASMVPVIGKDELGLSAFSIGILASTEGLGTFIGCVLISFWRTQRFTQIFLFGATIYLSFLLLFSLSALYTLSLLILFLAGLGHSGFSVGQSTLVFAKPDPEVRGRIMGLVTTFIGVQPIGILHAGFLADSFGGSTAVTIMAAEGLIALGICWMIWPEMRRHEKTSAA